MRVTYVLGISLALAFLVESLPGENFVEDEEFKNDPRHHTKRCKTDADCVTGVECCSGYFRPKCKLLRTEGQYCMGQSLLCSQKCQNGLECKKKGFWSLYKCTAKPAPPTEEPGSGDMSI
ncbi:uncharacterized protein LOC114957994 [Acropora millepora]|uniref:uncharacterized protein LOC114957994 n=1 Tax=Acropora millepora TaxID=45264 RepID=UPI001CF10719|nr:uncharacterized protein LOC114957994 [Acropora millepora]